MVPTRYTNLEAARARFGDRVDRLAPFFSRTDPLADDAVAAMSALGPGQGFALLERMLEGGLSAEPAAPAALRDFFAEATRVPAWLDWPTIDRGGDVLLRAGLAGGLVLGAMSLPLGYASPAGNKPLVLSGRLTEQAPRRLSETSRFVQAVSQPGGMRPGGDGLKITLKVRIMHAHVRRMLLRSDRWDSAAWGAPINQHDMAATTLLFSLVVLEGLRRFGFEIGHDEAERYMHLWRWVGLVSGVDTELLPASQIEGLALADLIHLTQGDPDDDSRALVRALMDTPIASARTPREKREAPVRAQIGRGILRGLLGPELATKLGVGPTRWEGLMRLFKTGAFLHDRAARVSPSARRRAIVRGERYWEEVVKIGLRGGPYDFKPQEKLGRVPVSP
ncbi:MAG: oxygenase MpaB family protein [Polyangiaceae bacterium]